MPGTDKFYKVRVSIGANVHNPYSQLLDLRPLPGDKTADDATAEFLKGLPSYNESNFARFQPDTSNKSSTKRASVYLPTTERPTEQIITTEKTSILLRYLQQHYEKKQKQEKARMKRDTDKAGPSSLPDHSPRKKSKLDP